MKGGIVSTVESFVVVVVNTDAYEGKIKKILHWIKPTINSPIRNDWMVFFHVVFENVIKMIIN